MKKIIFALIGFIVLVLLAWWLIARAPSTPAPARETVSEEAVEPSVPAAEDESSAEVESAVEVEIPVANPAAGTNPFSGSYKNPFE